MTHSTNHLLFLGTGGSLGIPVVGCPCEVCASPSSFNKRTRPGALLTVKGKKIWIDPGPDFRNQALAHGIESIDGVIFTHAHNDHSAGVDDLRVFNYQMQAPIPTLLSSETYSDLRQRFNYIFDRKPHASPGTVTQLSLTQFPSQRGKINFLGIPIHYFTYEQAGMAVNGLRIGKLAYVTDIKKFPETIYDDLTGVKTLIISALRLTPSPVHFSVDEAIAFSRQIGAEQTWLTHIGHELDHNKTNAYLPEDIRMAYDGLSIPFYLE